MSDVGAIWRICLRFFGIFPVQRWIAGIGLTLMILELGLSLLGPGVAGRMYSLGLACIVLSSIATAGLFFLGQSANRAQSLAPGFRSKMLLALVMHLGLLLAAWALWLARWSQTSEVTLSIGTGLVYPMFFLSWLYIAAIVAARSVWSLFGALIPTVMLGYWLGQGGPAELAASGISPAWLAAALTIIGWSVFGSWYLRVGTVRFGNWHNQGGRSAANRARKYWRPDSPVSAARALLAPHLQVPFRVAAMQIVVTLAIAGAVFLAMNEYLDDENIGTKICRQMIRIIPLILAVHINQIARRSRLVWMHFGSSRYATFRLAEYCALHLFSIMFFCLAALMIMAQLIHSDLPLRELVGFLAVGTAHGLFVMYFSLMFVRGFRAPDIGFIVAFALFYLAADFVVINVPAIWGALVVAAELGCALACRQIAVARWQRIDWITFKPLAWLDGPFSTVGAFGAPTRG